MKLNNEEINRYSRHLTLPEVGMSGQLKLKRSSVLMIGAGGLGSPLGMYLGAVGVGKIKNYLVSRNSKTSKAIVVVGGPLRRLHDVQRPKIHNGHRRSGMDRP